MRKRYKILILCYIVILIVMQCSCSYNNTMVVNIGYQSVTAQTWGALIIKNQLIFQKKLEERFPNKEIQINWYDEISGASINANMISGKYHLGFMGDMPCLINGYNSSISKGYNSILVAIDGKGFCGKNQGIVVSKDSNIKEVSDLVGKTISVPIGSSSHYMLLQILSRHNISNKVTILHQDVTIASSLLKTHKTDAFAVWDPYPKVLLEDNSIELLLDGSESGIDYLTGIMANKDWAENNEDIVVLFLESLIESHSIIKNNPELASAIFTLETGFPENITSQEVKEIRWDAAIYAKDRLTFEKSLDFLINLQQIKNFDINNIIDITYIDKAIENLSMNPIDYKLTEWPDYLY